jgi:WXG100 family type VII secretion target
MVDEIRANYEELGQVAGRFTRQSQAIEGMLRELRGRLEKLENKGWIGRGSDAFFAEMRGEVLPAVTRLIEALGQGAQATNEIARNIRTAEEQASATFRSE